MLRKIFSKFVFKINIPECNFLKNAFKFYFELNKFKIFSIHSALVYNPKYVTVVDQIIVETYDLIYNCKFD